ncbi:MAG TPA: rRNA pseudouridine synthase [Candidatus Blautia intestinavium]|nr:rRNA pseudouridine synthase [Candidatus Blautia intestinavium]
MEKMVRLDKFLADAGKGTRSEVKKEIKKGLVLVNGTTVKSPEQKISPGTDLVLLRGEPVLQEPEFAYYLLYKPAGWISATEDRREKTVMELVPSGRKGLFPVGRLDKDTEGLLLITNDGMLAHELLSPARHVEKTYFVRVRGAVSEEDRIRLEQGVDIGEDRLTLPAKAEILGSCRKDGIFSTGETEDDNRAVLYREEPPEEYTELLLTICEGKFHQVKRMMEAVGKKVVYLKRISMGPLKLPEDLKKGECRPLTEKEVQELKQTGKR